MDKRLECWAVKDGINDHGLYYWLDSAKAYADKHGFEVKKLVEQPTEQAFAIMLQEEFEVTFNTEMILKILSVAKRMNILKEDSE